MGSSLVGKTIGDYELVRELGRGAMGIVYKAQDKTLHRNVALKLLPKNFAENEDFVVRFQQEARAAAQINHPNVVTIYSVGNDGEHHYIAMEYVMGKTLDAEIRASRKIDVRRSLEIVAGAASGLSAAHKRRIYHRDIKPSNIMIGPGGVPKILDFGIARLTLPGRESTDNPGEIFGTPAYMSPEQCKGEKSDARSDIFSLGITLFEMLTGKLPWISKSRHELALMIVEDPCPSVRRYTSEVPDSVVEIIQRMLEKEPRGRFQTADALESQIRLALETLDEDVRRMRSGEAMMETPSVRGTPPYPGTPPISGTPPYAGGTPAYGVKRPTIASATDSTGPLKLASVPKTDAYDPLAWQSNARPRRRIPLPHPAIAIMIAVVVGGAGFFFSTRRMAGEVVRATGHSGEVFSVAVSPKGRYAFSAGEDGTVRGWDLENSDEKATLFSRVLAPRAKPAGKIDAHSDFVNSIALAPDGLRLLSGSTDRTAAFWNLDGGREIFRLKDHEGPVYAVAVSPNSKLGATAGADRVVRLWNLSNGSRAGTLEGHTAAVQSLAISPNGQVLASGSGDHSVRLWDLASRSHLGTLEGHKETVAAVAFSADSKYLASGAWDGTMRVWKLSDGSVRREFDAHGGRIWAIAFAPTGERILSGGSDSRMKLWDPSRTEPIAAFRHFGARDVLAVAFMPDGTGAVSGDSGGIVRQWRLPD